MEINKNTKVKDLLKRYPFLKDELIQRYPKFKILNSRIGMKLIENADLEKVSEKGNVEVERIIRKINELIIKHEQ